LPKIIDFRTFGDQDAGMDFSADLPQRSIHPVDYQDVPRPIAAMAKKFSPPFEIALHEHTRDQLLYAASGVMRIQTDAEAWIVPPDRAVYMPAGTRHSVGIRGNLEMRTLYITQGMTPGMTARSAVIEVSDLLRFSDPRLDPRTGPLR
jgi:quercetin dioxygenase-like cupin family protein